MRNVLYISDRYSGSRKKHYGSRQDFTAEKPNQRWCTDFTYLFLKNHEARYNCTILDFYDCSVIASITDRNITSELAIRTPKKALESQPSVTAV
ncbi:MAG: transposase family protein [Lachnospiraceae bacterium]|jgi:transposase InsO family protein|nr:transposase family protein [Lachnospiraceae bacterium]